MRIPYGTPIAPMGIPDIDSSLITGHFREQSFEAIYCTATDNQIQSNKITHAPETQKNEHRRLAPAKTNMKLQNPGLVVCYDIPLGNGVGLI